MADDQSGLIPITPQEEKELRRVYDLLSDYHIRRPLEIELKLYQKPNQQTLTNYESSKVSKDTQELVEFSPKSDEIKRKISEIDSNPNKKISAADLTEMFKELGQKITRKEIEEIIWECDEDLDQCLNWTEFKLMFSRNIMDKTGLEPSRMYNLAQFLIYDRNRNGYVSVDETMGMLYARYGRAKMEVKLKELFGDQMPETGRIGGGEINYPKYLTAVEKIQMQTFLNTTKGKMITSKTGKKSTPGGGGGAMGSTSTRLPSLTEGGGETK